MARDVAASAAPVLPYQTMTIAVGFEAGTFTPFDSSYLASPWGWLQAIAGLGARRRVRLRRRHARAAAARRAGAADDHRGVHAAARDRRARERGAARPHHEGDPGRGARAGGGRAASASSKATASSSAGVKLKAAADRPVAGRRRRSDAAGRAVPAAGMPGEEYEFGRTRHAVLVGGAEDPQGSRTRSSRDADCAARCRRACARCPILAAIAASALVFVARLRSRSTPAVDPLIPILADRRLAASSTSS